MSICDKPYTSTDKWTASVISGLSFLMVSSPYTYSLTNAGIEKIADSLDLDDSTKNIIRFMSTNSQGQGCPTTTGLIVHSVLYTLLVRLMLEKRNLSGCKKPYTTKDKWITSTVGGLMFMTISSPCAYSITNSITSFVNVNTVDDKGCANVQGLLIHTVIFTLFTRLLMR